MRVLPQEAREETPHTQCSSSDEVAGRPKQPGGELNQRRLVEAQRTF